MDLSSPDLGRVPPLPIFFPRKKKPALPIQNLQDSWRRKKKGKKRKREGGGGRKSIGQLITIKDRGENKNLRDSRHSISFHVQGRGGGKERMERKEEGGGGTTGECFGGIRDGTHQEEKNKLGKREGPVKKSAPPEV